MFNFSNWLRKNFLRNFRSNKRQVSRRKPERRLNLELLEERVNPSPNIMAGGVIHLPFTAIETEGSAGATVWTGNAAVNPTLLDFTDSTGTTSDYSVTVNWGDGSAPQTFLSTNLNAPFLVTTSGGSGMDNFHVVPTSTLANAHIYDEAPAGNQFTITVTDVGSGNSTGPVATPFTAPLNVEDAPLLDTTPASALPNQTGAEGVAFGTVTIATFTDDNPVATAADYTQGGGSLAVNFGAGALQSAAPAPTYTAVEVSSSSTQSFWDVDASGLVFAEPGTYTPAVTVNDDGGQSVSIPDTETPSFTISDAPLTNTTPSGSIVHATEGNAINVVLMTFNDANQYAPQSDFSVTSVTFSGNPNFLVSPTYTVEPDGAPSGGFSHWEVVATGTISEEGDYTATVSVADVDGSTASTSSPNIATIDVADAPLTDTTPAPNTIIAREGNITPTNVGGQVLMTFSDANPFAPTSDYDYPGAVSVSYTNSPDFISGPTYSVQEVSTTSTASNWEVTVDGILAGPPGNYAATVTVTDAGGATVTDTNSTIEVTGVTVNAGSGTPNPLTTINEGESTPNNTIVGTFTDPGNTTGTFAPTQSAAAPQYTAVINWGDGTSTTVDSFHNPGDFVYTGSGGTFDVEAPAHQYVEESVPGSYTISLSVSVTGPQLFENGGFETGDFTGYVQGGNLGDTGVDAGTHHGDDPGPHSGSFAAFLGPVGSDGTLTQNVPTVSGQTYVLSYYLESDGGLPNDFSTTIGGTTVSSLTNIAAQPYTQFTFSFTATGASTTVQFAFRDDPGELYLDDIGVVPVTPFNTSTQNTDSITVNEVAVVVTPASLTQTLQEGGTTGLVTVGTFVDPAGPESESNYAAVINWGDGTTSAGQITPDYAGATAITALTGFNQDVVYEAGTTTPAVTTDFDGSFDAWFQSGAEDENSVTHTDGLTPSFVSASGTPFTFQDFTADNVLLLGNGNFENTSTGGTFTPASAGTLTLTTPTAYTGISILASSSDNSGPTNSGMVTINFTDGSSVTVPYNADEWTAGAQNLAGSASRRPSTGQTSTQRISALMGRTCPARSRCTRRTSIWPLLGTRARPWQTLASTLPQAPASSPVSSPSAAPTISRSPASILTPKRAPTRPTTTPSPPACFSRR